MSALSFGQSGSFCQRHARLAWLAASCVVVSPPIHAQTRASQNLEEVIVTAQKTQERLQDVPVPVTALDAESLVTNNQVRLQDYYTKVPGLGLSVFGPESGTTVTIRGLTMGGQTNPTVGIVVDEVPYGASVVIGNYLTVPDIDPGDLSRVEVLRGPQGTLYGASSIGGLLKFATIDPSTDAWAGRMQAGMSSVKGGDDIGYNVRGSMNAPLGDTFAVRLSGFTSQDPGYIDNVATGEDDVNERDSAGGRLAALWRPSDNFSLRVSALLQDIDRKGSSDVHQLPGLGDMQQSALRGSGGYSRTTEAYGATMQAKLGSVDFISATGYSIDETEAVQDVTPSFFASFAESIFGVGGAADFFHNNVEKVTQELRFTIPIGERLQWMIGGFYTREEVDAGVDFTAVDPATGAKAGRLIAVRSPSNEFEEYAAFTNLTVTLTDVFDVQVGVRFSENEQSFHSVRNGPLSLLFFGSDPSFVDEVTTKDSPSTYLVTPRWRVSPELMVYARFASGYRPGAPNANCGLAPCQSDADTTRNYEIGMKGSALDDALSYEASVYYIDWKDIQLEVLNQGFAFIDNGGDARSQGIEITMKAQPTTGLTVSAWAAWNEAELTESFPATSTLVGASGDQLPYGSPFSASLSLEQEFTLGSRWTGFIGGSASYVDEREGVFTSTFEERERFPSYTQVDVRAGVQLDSWTAELFVNNVSDKRGVLGGGAGNFIPFAFSYVQPRTMGLTLTKTF